LLTPNSLLSLFMSLWNSCSEILCLLASILGASKIEPSNHIMLLAHIQVICHPCGQLSIDPEFHSCFTDRPK
jgi:hypothetical protein